MVSREHLDPTTQQYLLQDERIQAQIRLSRWLSHDLNNLFMIILNYAQILKEHLEKTPHLHDADVVERTAQRGLDLAHHLQRFSRDGQSGPPIEVDLHALLRQHLPRWQEHLGPEHPLRFFPSEQSFFVLLPPARIEEMLVPLFDNAKEALPQGGPIRLRTEYTEITPPDTGARIPAGPYVCITVQDDGCGIPHDLQEIAIEPMATHHPRTQRSGMGLALVYSTLRQLSGWMNLRSQEDIGTEVHLYLPLLQYSTSSNHAAVPRPQIMRHIMLCLPSLSFAERDRLCSQLEEDGYTTLEAEDSMEILQIKRRFQDEVHLLITESACTLSPETLETLRLSSPALQVLIFSAQGTPPALSWQHNVPHPPRLEDVQQALRKLEQQQTTNSIPEDPRR
jgi:nitrogen-specific signal transduction histidine kinase